MFASNFSAYGINFYERMLDKILCVAGDGYVLP
jgi:hypothetical protein